MTLCKQAVRYDTHHVCPLQALAVGVPVVLGGLVGSICFEDQATWYRTLRRPFWEPPPPVFGQVHALFR